MYWKKLEFFSESNCMRTLQNLTTTKHIIYHGDKQLLGAWMTVKASSTDS